MKVVRVVSELDFGGVEKVLAISLPALKNQNGLELKLIVLGKGGKVAEELVPNGIEPQILSFNPRIPNFKLIKKLQNILIEFAPDVVHTQGGEANFHGIWAAKLANVPLVIGEEIGIPNHHTYWRYVFKWVYRKANKVIAISEAVKEAIVELEEVEASKVSVVYNPVNIGIEGRDFSLRSSGRNDQITSNSPFVFVCTCRLVPIKNLDRLIKAFEGLVKENQNRELLLRIVGEGPERNKLESLSQKLEMGGCVEFLGFQEDVWPFLNEADSFILPSLREGSSVSLAEAMSAGLPSIVTKVGGASEILGKSQSGILIDPLKTLELQSAMQKLLDIPYEERISMGQRAEEEAKRFSVEHYLDSLLSIYAFSDLRLKPSDF
ncbi:glycosyltransferase [Algoriphagus lutimaris]|uniref:glycosyltransferase n=1 Tax=Algoriphagus lutimaris TaxID=613197 RepID=UPI00196B42B0|nr:glycosyltransferase [Algoriphagus lutimaris]MBN3518750.1 glycosyltransferase [Algoriphagus lutimaris]